MYIDESRIYCCWLIDWCFSPKLKYKAYKYLTVFLVTIIYVSFPPVPVADIMEAFIHVEYVDEDIPYHDVSSWCNSYTDAIGIAQCWASAWWH